MQDKTLQFINDKLQSLVDSNPEVKNFKRQAKILHKKLKAEYLSKNKKDFIPLRQCQDLIAQQNGYKHWHEFHTIVKKMYQDKEDSLFIKYSHNVTPQFNSYLKPIYVGYNQQLGMQGWLDQNALKKHVFLQGIEEKYKLELNLIQSAIKNNDHIIYMGSSSEQINTIKQLAIQSGREKDIRTISFMTDYSKTEDTNWYFPKNLPFSSGALTEMIVSLIDEELLNKMWKDHIISLLSAVLMALTYMRDQGEIVLDFKIIQTYLSLDNIMNLYNKDLPLYIHESLKAYLFSLPNYELSQNRQNDKVLEQHGYVQMILLQQLACLTDCFTHLIKDVENKEAAQNTFNQLCGTNENLIFLITYPEFSKAPDQLSSIPYMLINIIRNGFINKLTSRLDILNKSNQKNFIKTTWFIKNCPLPKNFNSIAAQAIAANLQLILSYKNFSDYVYDNNEEKSILGSINIKCHDFKLVNNKLHYKILVDAQNENLIL